MVGSHLLLELTRQHDRIRAIHRPLSNRLVVREIFDMYLDNPEEQLSRIEWVPGDITDIDSLLEAMDGIKYVYHAAAIVQFGPDRSVDLMHNNVVGTANVVNACLEKKIRKLCHVSSTAALGSAMPGEEIEEDRMWTWSKDRSAYSVSKFDSEMEVWRGIAEGLNAVIVNPSIIIGPGAWNQSSCYMFSAVWKGLKFYSEGVTGYVDVRDVVRAMVHLMNSDIQGERFAVSSENLTYRQILTLVAQSLGKDPPRYRGTAFLVAAAWRLDWLLHLLTGKPRSFTRDAAKSSRKVSLFSNRKIREATGMDFLPVEQSVKETALLFLKSHSKPR